MASTTPSAAASSVATATVATSINRSSSSTNPSVQTNLNNNNNNNTNAISIEDLYKYFGILADAKEQAGNVSILIYLFLCVDIIYIK